MSESYHPKPNASDEALVLLDRAVRAAISSLAQNTGITFGALEEMISDLLVEDIEEMAVSVDQMLGGTYQEDMVELSAENRVILEKVKALFLDWEGLVWEENEERFLKDEGMLEEEQDEG